jgi:cytochrome c oxidase cbb3-type subunit 3
MRKLTLVLALSAFAAAAWFVNPPEGNAAQSAARIFSSKCSGCHGPDGSGNIAGTPNFTSAEWQSSRSDAQLLASIRDGKGKVMPAWGKQLSEAQISALVRHVRGLKK